MHILTTIIAMSWFAWMVTVVTSFPPNSGPPVHVDRHDINGDDTPSSVYAFRGEDGWSSARVIEADVSRMASRPSGTLEVVVRGPEGGEYPAAVSTDALVRWSRRPSAEDFERLGVRPVRRLVPSTHLWLVRARRPERHGLALASDLSARAHEGLVRSASPDLHLPYERRQFVTAPNDPRYGGQWYLERIQIESAWSRSSGDPETTIAIVDNGCDLDHPDLRFSARRPGFDAVDQDLDPRVEAADASNHGTACAGVAAAQGDNGIGIAGACPECTLQCIRLLPPAGSLIPTSAAVQAFEHIRSSSVAVASNSWGYVGDTPVPPSVRQAIERLQTDGNEGRGTLVVFAAGNSRSEIPPHDVAALPDVVTVTATNLFDELTSFSSFGPSVDLSAPGGTVTTDLRGPRGSDPGDYTANFGGTSAACPLVAGVAGLLFSAAPSATALAVRSALVGSARPAPFAEPDGRGHDPEYGYGIVDPGAALDILLEEGPTQPSGDAGPRPRDGGETPGAPEPVAVDPSQGSGCRHTPSATSKHGPTALAPLALLALLVLSVRTRRTR